MAYYDLIILGGTIHDGTGDAVLDGRIAAIGFVDSGVDEVTDASGMIVTPGLSMLTPIMVDRLLGKAAYRLRRAMVPPPL